jgi:CBS domain-containing protein
VVTAREIMALDAEYVDRDETVGAAAVKMRDLRVGSLPVCEDGNLAGVLTDRDIVVNCIAGGSDPYTTHVGDVTDAGHVAIEAHQSIESALLTMALHHLRRVPVIEGRHLIGMLIESEVAQSVSEQAGAVLLETRRLPMQSRYAVRSRRTDSTRSPRNPAADGSR